ncbi:hypothetical protein ACFPTY_07430 [Halomonas beimenensis]|uniref:hypothetical protein n=1 Tax=Halomonas beimenensis TaxID=475662 RepID=UPI0031DEF14A
MTPLAEDPQPREVLRLARDHEAQEMRRYRRLAFRFLPFGQGLSRLMASLGIACEHRRQACEAAGGRLGLSLPLEAERARQVVTLPGVASGCLILGQGHALAVLKRTRAAAEQSRRFSRYCLDSRLLPALSPLWRDLASQKAAECRLLDELMAAYAGTSPLPPATSVRPRRAWSAAGRPLAP